MGFKKSYKFTVFLNTIKKNTSQNMETLLQSFSFRDCKVNYVFCFPLYLAIENVYAYNFN